MRSIDGALQGQVKALGADSGSRGRFRLQGQVPERYKGRFKLWEQAPERYRGRFRLWGQAPERYGGRFRLWGQVLEVLTEGPD